MNPSPVFLTQIPLAWWGSEKGAFQMEKLEERSQLMLFVKLCVFQTLVQCEALLGEGSFLLSWRGKWSEINSFHFLIPWSQPPDRCLGAAYRSPLHWVVVTDTFMQESNNGCLSLDTVVANPCWRKRETVNLSWEKVALCQTLQQRP